MKNRLIIFGAYLLGALIVVLTGLKMFYHLTEYKDLILWDEAFYMFRGLTFFEDFPREWGPVYCLWYLLLYFIPQDTIQLYFLNFKLLAIAGPVMLYLLLIRSRIHPLAAIMLSLFFLFSDINISSWPYVSHFGLVVILGGLLLSSTAKSSVLQWMTFCGLALLLSYIRPEYYLSFFIFIGILFVRLVQQKFKIQRKEAIVGIMLLLFVVAGHILIGNGLTGNGSLFGSGQYSRQVFAFGNHYAINVGNWDGIEHAWLIWESIFKDEFEVSNSILATIASNWPEFFKHIGQNIIHYLEYSLHYWSDVIVPGHFIPRNNIWNLLLLAIPFIVLISLGKTSRVFSQYWRRISNDRIFIALLIFALTAELSCVFIYPRDHYLLLQAPFVIYAVALFFQTKKLNTRNLAVSLIVGIAILAIAPSGNKLNHFSHWNQRSEPHNLKAVQAMQNLNVTSSCQLLEDEGGLSLFIQNPNITSVFPVNLKYDGSIVEYIQNSDVKLIFMSYILETDPNLRDDELWHDLKSNPEDFSFRRQNIEDSDTYLLIHESI